MPGHDIIVVGASMGGFETLRTLVRDLPETLPAAVLVVLHTAPFSPGLLGDILDQAGALPARLAENGEPIHQGTIYIAPPDHHLLVKHDTVRLSRGPQENRSRPAIDPLFRTAAVTYRSRVVGVVLSGTLDDGAAGLLAVKRCGGLAIVQAPTDAAYPEMPRYALEAVEADHIVPLSEMGALLSRLAEEPAGEAPPLPRDLLIEAYLTEPAMEGTDALDEIGTRTSLTCPDCGGVLWQMPNQTARRYRCHIGHGYTETCLLDEQAEATEQALLVALRTMEDRIKVLDRIARDNQKQDRLLTGNTYKERVAELKQHTQQIRQLILGRRSEETPYVPLS